MNKKMLLCAISAAITSFAGIAAASWVYHSPITGVGCWEDGTCYISYPNNVSAQAPQCQVLNEARFSLSTAGGQEMYRTAVSAFLAGREVRALLSGCSTGGDGKTAARAVRLGVQ